MSQPDHPPIVDARVAMACTKCMRRDFGSDQRWVCPEHGRTATYRQANHRYFGRATTKGK